MINAALVAYPLTDEYRLRLEGRIGGEIVYLHLTELRGKRLDILLRSLRSLQPDQLLLPMQDENHAAILPIMQVIAALTHAKNITIVTPDLRCVAITRRAIAARLVTFFGVCCGICFAAVRSRFELAWLSRAPRARVSRYPARRVLYLKTNLGFGVKAGGSVGHVNGVISGLVAQRYHVDFASGESLLKTSSGVTLLPIQFPPIGLPEEFNHYQFQRIFIRRTIELLKGRQHDFIYHRLSIANYAGVMLSRYFKIPLVLEYNGSEVWAARHWGRHLRFEKLARSAEDACFRHAHLVITVSNVLSEELVSRGVERQRIICYPNCVDAEKFDPARFSRQECEALRKRLGIELDAIIVTFVGTFGAWHGVETLARAIAHMVENEYAGLMEHKIRFLLVGDGVKMQDVRQILRDERCSPFYRLTGLVPQTEAAGYLAASDILVSPHVPNPDGSRFFGSPTKLFEYMAMAKPIVASNLDQIGEVLADGLDAQRLPIHPPPFAEKASAILVEPANIAAIVRGIWFLVERPEWRQVLGNNARKLVLARYTWRLHVAALIDRVDALFGMPLQDYDK